MHTQNTYNFMGTGIIIFPEPTQNSLRISTLQTLGYKKHIIIRMIIDIDTLFVATKI